MTRAIHNSTLVTMEEIVRLKRYSNQNKTAINSGLKGTGVNQACNSLSGIATLTVPLKNPIFVKLTGEKTSPGI